MASSSTSEQGQAGRDRRAPRTPDRTDLSRATGFALVGLALVMAATIELFDSGWAPPARWRLFDYYQRLMPRENAKLSAVVVAIDEESTALYGAWPWPRSRLADLLDRLTAARPAAIGLDMVFEGPDRGDPRRLVADAAADLRAALARGLGEVVEPPRLAAAVAAAVHGLAGLPSSDEALEFAIFAAPAVLARRAALDREVTARAASAAGGAMRPDRQPAAVRVEGPDPGARLAQYRAAIPNLARFEATARGLGFISTAGADPDGVIRQVPLVVRVAGQIVPTMPVEMLRVALAERTGAPVAVVLETDQAGVRALRLGPWRVPTDGAGRLRLHYGPAAQPLDRDGRQGTIELSAATVLGGGGDAAAFRPAELRDALLLIGVTGVAGVDAVSTPVAASTRGVYVHAETIENIVGGNWLERPPWAVWVEFAMGLGAIALVGWLAPRSGRRGTALLVAAMLLACVLLSTLAFALGGILIGPLLPGAAVLVATVIVRGGMFAHARRRARELETELHREQVDRARLAGELSAARAIQLGLLPDPAHLPGLPDTLQIHAVLEPAREVGGDLYDAFMLDTRRLFFVVGDVAGKGIPASLFMALGKTLCKSSALRGVADLETLVATANVEIARDNPGEMFITALFGIVDVRSGVLEFCNAGHDDPIVVAPDGAVRALSTPGGPPLCMLDDFPYPADRATLAAGETVVVVTDGVTEAQDGQGALYGQARLRQLLGTTGGLTPAATVAALLEDVERHAAGAEPYDDLTIFALRFTPAAPA